MLDPKTFQQLRKEYTRGELRVDTMDGDPFQQFTNWFKELISLEVSEPNAMILATCGKDARPSSRVVLLKSCDADGFVWYTNYGSKKGQQLQENNQASLLFYWPELQRQVRIEGLVNRVSREMSRRYFSSRPPESQLGALASRQSSHLASRAELEETITALRQQYSDREVPLPEDWGGYLLQPDYYEFWQGRENRLHDRIAYEKNEDTWKRSRLSP